MCHAMIDTHGLKFSVRQNYPHTHTARSKQPSLQNPQIWKDEHQVPNTIVVISSCSKTSIDLLTTSSSSSSLFSIISFLKRFFIGIYISSYRFMPNNNIILINFIIQNKVSLLLSHQHCSFPLLFLIKVYYITPSTR